MKRRREMTDLQVLAMRRKQAEAPPFVRAEDHIEVPLGTVLVDEDGEEQVFIGWRRNTVGHEMIFVRSYRKDNFRSLIWDQCEPFIYHASGLVTLLRKFPGLKEFLK
jgi:hypothetical protein